MWLVTSSGRSFEPNSKYYSVELQRRGMTWIFTTGMLNDYWSNDVLFPGCFSSVLLWLGTNDYLFVYVFVLLTCRLVLTKGVRG